MTIRLRKERKGQTTARERPSRLENVRHGLAHFLAGGGGRSQGRCTSVPVRAEHPARTGNDPGYGHAELAGLRHLCPDPVPPNLSTARRGRPSWWGTNGPTCPLLITSLRDRGTGSQGAGISRRGSRPREAEERHGATGHDPAGLALPGPLPLPAVRLPVRHPPYRRGRSRAPAAGPQSHRRGHCPPSAVPGRSAGRGVGRRGLGHHRPVPGQPVVFLDHRRGHHLRPARRPVRARATHAHRLLHPDPDRLV